MVNEAVDGRGGSHGIFEDAFPFGERKIAGQQHTSSLIAFRQQREDNLHLLACLPDVAQIVDDHSFVAGILLDELAQLEIALGNQQFLHEHLAGDE